MLQHNLKLVALYVAAVLNCGFSLPILSPRDRGLLVELDSPRDSLEIQSNMEPSMHLTPQDEVSYTYQPRETLFTKDQQEKFCLNLIDRLEELEKSLSRDNFSFERNLHDFSQSNSTKKHNEVLSPIVNSSKDVDPGFFLKETYPDSNDVPKFQVLHNGQNDTLLNLFKFYGDKPILDKTDEINYQTTYKLDSTSSEIGTLSFIPNCRSYFKNKGNFDFLFNLINRINDRNMKLPDLIDFSISPKQKEQLHLLNILNVLNNASNFPEKVISYAINDENGEISPEDNLFLVNEQEANNKTVEIPTINFSWNNEEYLWSDNNTNIQRTSEIKNESFFEIFQFGSGNGESSAGEERILEDSNFVNGLDMNISGSGDSSERTRLFYDAFSNSENISLISKEYIFETEIFSDTKSGFIIIGSGNGN